MLQVDDPYADVALPKNYPKEWKEAAASAYAGVVEPSDSKVPNGQTNGQPNGTHEPSSALGDEGGLDHFPQSDAKVC